jgi:hypothetical protein
MNSPHALQQFAEQHRVRLNRDNCSDAIVRGKLGHLYAHDASRFGIVLEPPANTARLDNRLRSRKRGAITAGFLLHQEEEFEAILLFDPSDSNHAALAPTNQLVTLGPYRYVRNPIHIREVTFFFALGLYLRSTAAFLFSPTWLLLCHWYVVLIAERGLNREFGTPYGKYGKEVPR